MSRFPCLAILCLLKAWTELISIVYINTANHFNLTELTVEYLFTTTFY
jgi:hypothetical protein